MTKLGTKLGTKLSERLAALSPEQRKLLGLSLGAAKPPSIQRVSRGQRQPLTASQEQIWLETQLNPDAALYNESVHLRLHGRLDVEALRRAAALLMRRHEAWRTRIVEEDGRAWQRVDEAKRPEADDDGLPWTQRRASAAELPTILDELGRRPFDLARGPVLALTLIELGDDTHLLVLVVHHIAFDGQSAAIYADELLAAYTAHAAGREPTLAPLNLQLVDHAAALASIDHRPDLDWWARALDGAPATLDLPTDTPRPEQRSGAGARLHFQFGPERSAAIRELARELGATPFAVLLGLLTLVVGARTHAAEIVVGTPVSVRGPEFAGVIGPFLNTVALRLRTAPEGSSFDALVSHVREVLAHASDHGQAPLQQVLARLQRRRQPGRTPVFEILFNLYKTHPTRAVEGLAVERVVVEQGTARFDLALDIEDGPDGFAGWWEFDTALFVDTTIARIHAHLGALLDAVTVAPRIELTALPRLGPDEARALARFNTTEQPLGPPACLHTLFAEQARRTPDHVALIDGDQTLSFAELARRAYGLAHLLVARGVKPDSFVGVCADRSTDMIVAVLAVLAAGAGYLPLDPAYPAERLAFMVEDARTPIVIGHRRHLEALPSATPRFELERGWEHTSAPPQIEPNPDHVAYLAYTSGSTGRPNGVLGLHRGIVNRFRWMWARFPFAAGEVGSQKTALSFLDSCWEMFGPLLQGVPVAIVPDQTVKDPRALVECLARHRVSRLVLVPSLLEALLDTHPRLGEQLPALRVCVCSGEALPIELVRRCHAILPATQLINLYGSSELSADTTCCLLDPARPDTWTSIGEPIANTHVFVVDEAGHEQPIGVPGELCVTGVGLARGYWERPELNTRRFVPNPFTRGGPIMHRTGDLGRWLGSGQLEYLGRLDHQIKIRGFRVEPGEIERVLGDDPAITTAIVGLREFTTAGRGAGKQRAGGDRRLVAWYVSEAPLPTPRLRAIVAEALPEFMIPSHFVHLDQIPRTPSGKLDRHQLPLPSTERGELGTPYERPRTELERSIAKVWAAHLGLDRVGVLDNFFELGGHSLLLVEVYGALQLALGRELSMMQLFRHPSVRALAGHLEPDDTSNVNGAGEPAGPNALPNPRRGRGAVRASTRSAARAGQVAIESSPATCSLEACDTVIEALVQRVLSDELGRAIGPTEVFFAAGGTPEQAHRAINRLTQATGVALPARALLQAPTARQLGLYVQAGRREPKGEGWSCSLGTPERAPAISELCWEAAVAIHGRVDPDMLRTASGALARHHPGLGPEGDGWAVALQPGQPARVGLRVAASLADPTSTCALLDELLAHYAGERVPERQAGPTMGDLHRWRAAAAAVLVARGWARPERLGLPPIPPITGNEDQDQDQSRATLALPSFASWPAELPPTIVISSAWSRVVGPCNVLASGREHPALAGLCGPVDTFVHVRPSDPERTREQLLWALDHRELGDDLRPGALVWDHGSSRAPASVAGLRVEYLGPHGWQRRWNHELHVLGDTIHVLGPDARALAQQLAAALEPEPKVP